MQNPSFSSPPLYPPKLLSKPSQLRVMKNRVEFLYCAKQRILAHKKGFVIQACIEPAKKPLKQDGPITVGFTATKKTGNAVQRNRYKRRMRALARELLPQYGRSHASYVFIAKSALQTIEWSQLLKDGESALRYLQYRLVNDKKQ